MNAPLLVAVPPAVVTATLCAPAVPVGVTAVMLVALTTTILVAALPPTVTLVAPVKLVPVMVIEVPPNVVPDVGLTLVMVGNGTTYVNALLLLAVPPAVVTATLLTPAVPAGVLAVTEVLDTTTMFVAAMPPTVTLIAPVKLVPVMVIEVPPNVVPDVGETLVMVGTGTMYVNALVLVAGPPAVVTVTSFTPAVPAGVIAVMLVALTTTTLVAETPPTFTLVAPVKLVPVMVIEVPPSVVPDVGETLVMVGSGVMYVNALESIAVPPAVVTATLLAPAVPAGVFAVTEVLDTATTFVAATPPTVTLLAPVKLVPVMEIVVPPSVVPDVGVRLVRVGCGVMYVNNVEAVAIPLGVVTATAFEPAEFAGVIAVIIFDDTTTTLVAATPPTVTPVDPVKLVPEMVIAVPPKVVPDVGLRPVIVGAGVR